MLSKNRTALKTFKKILRVLLWILVGVSVFVVLLCVAVYLPPIQRFAVDKASAVVAEKTGMHLAVERFRLRFPIGISVYGATVVTASGDTLAGVGSVKADAALWPLMAGRVLVRNVSVENAHSLWRDTMGTLSVHSRLRTFTAESVSLGIEARSLTVSHASLDGADVVLLLGERTAPEKDTLPTAPWKFDVRRIDFSNVKYAMDIAPTDSARLAGSTGLRLDAGIVSGMVRGASVDLTEPLTVKTDRVELAESFFAYVSPGGTPPSSSAPPFNPKNIRADSLGLTVGDFSYRYTETGTGDISARLEGLHFTERSGLRVADAGGGFSMGGEGFSLKDFAVMTANSHLDLTATTGEGIMRVEAATPVSLAVSGRVGAGDLLFFVPLEPTMKRTLGGETVTLSANIGGTLGDISIARLTAEMPERITLHVHGKLHGVTDPKNISGNAAFDGTLERLDFVKGFIADTALRRRIDFPRHMTLNGSANFSPSLYEVPELTITADSGRLDVKGRLAMREKTYDATVRLDGFPIGRFLPRDSLGAATLSLAARGQGFDPFVGGGMNAEVEATIERLDYKRFSYSGMVLKASLADGKLDGLLSSSNEALRLGIALGGTLERDKYSAEIEGQIEYADLSRMGFSGGGEDEALAFGTNLDISAGYEPGAPSYVLDAAVDSTALRIGNALVIIDTPTTVRAAARPEGISVAVLSGDLTVDLSSPLSLDSLIRGSGLVGSEVRRQLAARHFSADSLQSAFPSVTLSMKAERVNILRELARFKGLDFRSVSADVSTAAGRPFAIDATVKGFRTGTLELDTIGVHAHRNGTRLDYALRMAGSQSGPASLGLIEVSGSAGGNTASVNIYQRNRADSVGFRFGIDASLHGKTLRAEMTPQNPILGYQRWTVNEGNSVEYYTNGKFRADLRLTGPSKGEYVNLTSASLPDIPDGALRLAMNAVALGPMLDLMPSPPPIGGILSSDLTFGIHGATEEETGIVAAKGTLGVGGFSYNKRRVADVAANVDFHADVTGTMTLDASIMLENKAAVKASGTYTKEEIDFTVAAPGIPLAVAEAFLPVDMTAKLSGNLDGNFRITGVPSVPTITGDVGFTDGRADVGMLGTAFGISPDRITVEGGRIAFNGFGLTAPNKQKLSIDGGLDFSDLTRPRADVTLSARNFQFVNSQHIGGSQVYGTAALNAAITAKGPFSAMVVRGDVALSEKTDIVYILRNQSKVKDMKQHIVEFTVFADSLYTDDLDTSAEGRGGMGGARIDMLVGVSIGEGLKATLSLDELNENRVELIGGGDLAFSMNTQGDMRLAGRYSLTGGTVYYRPPVIAQKVFAVKDGSYVEWTGEAAKPQFHVTATQKMEVPINHEGGMTEQVAFDISIDVSGSLSGIDMKFNVAAPGNLMIQNQLLAMSDEARMQQALTLLIYEQYTGPGVSTKRGPVIDANAVLNDFIAKEVNQWARNNLKGVDLSMGIDTRNEDPANIHTNYKYSVSKRMFSDRVKISIGGSVADNATSQNFAENLIDDVSLEYRLTRRDNMFLKVYRLNTRESILEGEVVETGAGFVLRKKINKLGDLFRRTRPKRVKSGKE